jgi:hypothetical protein
MLSLGCWVLWELRLDLNTARVVQESASADLHNGGVSATAVATNIQADLHRTLSKVNQAVLSVKSAADQLHSPKFQKAIFDLWAHADRTLGHLDSMTHHQSEVHDQELQIAAVSLAALKDLDTAIVAVKDQVNNPAIVASLDSLQVATQAAAGAAVELKGTITDMHEVTTYEKEKIMRPLRWFQRMEQWFLSFGADVAAKAVP